MYIEQNEGWLTSLSPRTNIRILKNYENQIIKENNLRIFELGSTRRDRDHHCPLLRSRSGLSLPNGVDGTGKERYRHQFKTRDTPRGFVCAQNLSQ